MAFKGEELEEIRAREGEWRSGVLGSSQARQPEKRDEFKNSIGIPVKHVYSPSDIPEFDYLKDLGFPGEYPYTRGPQPNMYRARTWSMRQLTGCGLPEDMNQRMRFLVSQGGTALSPTGELFILCGYEPDDPSIVGALGQSGSVLVTLKDYESIYEGIPLDKLSVNYGDCAWAIVTICQHAAVAEKQGVPWSKLTGTIGNNILAAYHALMFPMFPPEHQMRVVMNTWTWMRQNMPNFNIVSLSGYHMSEAGATPVQELAFTMADAICYLERAAQEGMHIDDLAPRFGFYFASGNNFFEEIAKFRAARRMWARIAKERFGAKKPESMRLKFHIQTSGAALTAQQPENNIIRATMHALAAVLGGCSSLHVDGMDEAITTPSEKAFRIAVRTQQIIEHETGVINTVDPLGGSYYLEYLTNETERLAWEYINKIDAMGGVLKGIEKNFFKEEIGRSAYEFQQKLNRKDKIIVGVNDFTSDEPSGIEVYEADPKVRDIAIERLRQVKAERDNQRLQKALDDLKRAAEGTENLVPLVLEAVKAYGTFAEIMGTMREVFGQYKHSAVI